MSVVIFNVTFILIGAKSFLLQRRFKLYADEDVVYIDRSAYGTERILLKWHKLQAIVLQQSLYQRSKELATVNLYTAGGSITLPYISITAAKEIMNYGLYKIETTQENWM